ncbi:AMP-binding protein [Actinosynnema sp. NPDC047251]|uniref:Amino acid adenylation domain-containing protein n=1 Tax=Saccharothrix espanaensis (strain ATCC 51144 / DSM 44229 / JCM 9112 / NBRC 15066 / NRRL 15764) TaxID=1179773 RepID=K0JZ75_SACES|nr:AMP-binding protein [Saccharothrix espanaensis]CCH29558.1 Amino acid adenylation domain-containing protein [Saccharothrix espanaensis DSM 44229]
MAEPRSCASALWTALCAAAASAPHEPAIHDGRRALTNAELAAAVGAAAVKLRELVPAASRVGVRLAPGVEQHIAVLGIVVAACTYVPFDVAWSAERTGYVSADAEVALMIEAGAPGVRSLPFDRLRPDAVPDLNAVPDPDVVAGLDVTPAPAVYVMYTSGTTGAPKGVQTSWPALRNRLAWMQDVHALGPDDTVLSKTSCGFDVSVWEFLWPRLHNARTSVLDVRDEGGWSSLWRVLHDDRVTVCHFVPSVARSAMRDPNVRPVPSLRLVALSGEVLDRDTAARLQELAPNARIVNMYGPTECAIDVSHWTFDAGQAWDPVPIGGGAANCTLTVRPSDDTGQGLLVISGIQVADGYIGAAAGSGGFTSIDGLGPSYDTGDLAVEVAPGVLSVVGRSDRQVKLNGVRVELDGLETVVRGHPAIQDCAVVLDADDPSISRVVVVCVPREPGTAPLTRAVRQFVRDGSAMEDFAFRLVAVDRLPLTASGKTDYPALEAHVREGSNGGQRTR